MQNEWKQESFFYLEERLSELENSENAWKYLELLTPLINLLWEQESGLKSGGTYAKEWELNELKIRVSRNG